MDPNIPPANVNGPALPQGAVPPANPPPQVGVAAPAAGAVQQPPAPPARRSRVPRGMVMPSSSSAPTGAPALLELAAMHPCHTEQRRAANLFLPDAQMLFHVLSVCDMMMNHTERFLRSCPAWLPIVSQLYVSVLWFVMILRVYVNSTYGSMYSSLLDALVQHLQITECLVPGPLVPFFQSLGATNGPFEWIGDLVPALPDFAVVWDSEGFHANPNTVRSLPIPALILDQLYYFATWMPAAQAHMENPYAVFEWYRNIFGQGAGINNRLNRLGPQLCGSLYTTQSQFDSARVFWRSSLQGFARITPNGAPLTRFEQILGFTSQAGVAQLTWFQQVTTVMQKYCQYFNGSVPLKSVLPTGIGAVALQGTIQNNRATRDWIYPTNAMIEPFNASRFAPLREFPDNFTVIFSHADHELEEQAEQYAVLTHTNLLYPADILTQHAHHQIDPALIREGSYWTMLPHRYTGRIRFKTQFAQIIASRYHQQAANRVD